MLIKTSELSKLDVINIEEGSYLGNIYDLDLDPESGRIRSLVVERPSLFFWRFKRDDLEIPWKNVVLIGTDVVLVRNRTWRR